MMEPQGTVPRQEAETIRKVLKALLIAIPLSLPPLICYALFGFNWLFYCVTGLFIAIGVAETMP